MVKVEQIDVYPEVWETSSDQQNASKSPKPIIAAYDVALVQNVILDDETVTYLCSAFTNVAHLRVLLWASILKRSAVTKRQTFFSSW